MNTHNLEAIINVVDALIVVLDRQGRIVRFNPACEKATGFSLAEVQGKPLWEILIPPEQVEGVRGVFNQLNAGMFPMQYENDWLTRSGGRVLIAWSNTALLDGNNEVEFVVGTGIDITERKKAEVELRQISMAIEQTSDGVAITNLEGNIHFVNQAWARMHGYESGELVGKHLSMFHTAEQLQNEVGVALGQTMQTGTYQGEVGHMRRDGSTFPTWMTVNLLKNADGKPIAMVGTIRDITAQKEQAARLRWLELAVKQNPDGIAIADMDGNIQFANAAWADLHGYTLEEIQGKHLSLFHTAEQVRQEVVLFNERVAQIGLHRGEMGHVKKDGTVFPTMMTVALIQNETGQPIGLVGIAHDITEQKRVQQKMEENQRLFQTFLNNFPDLAFAKDTQGRVILNNHQLEKMFKAEPGTLIGKTVYDLVPPEIAAPIWESEKRVLETGQIQSIEEIVPIGGEMRTKLSTKFPLYDTEGKITAIGGIAIDITEQKQAEAERAHLQAEIIEAQQRALKELATPIIPIMDRIIVMPLIGSIDTMRAKDITRALLRGISEYRAKIIILDITGVPIVDSGVANHLNKTIQAARLKGARTIVTGVSDAVAETIVDLGIDWSAIETLRDLQTGLVAALNSLGIKLSK